MKQTCQKCGAAFDRTAKQAAYKLRTCLPCRREARRGHLAAMTIGQFSAYHESARAYGIAYRKAGRRKLSEAKRVLAKALVSARITRLGRTAQRRAQDALNHAVKGGKIIRRSCSACGAPKAQAHHKDYSQPLDVVWLCQRCHAKEHRTHK
ncbi:MAG: hypothetical protein QGD90_01045 [Candidatus Hydrogenedentes bacterium]|nr:hypothetical protein [Candidatus Hydrogenedentota bacterium]